MGPRVNWLQAGCFGFSLSLHACLLTIDEDLIAGGGAGTGAAGTGGTGAVAATGGGSPTGGGGNGGGPVEPPGRARVLYTDLAAGPIQGGEDDLGAFVTLWGAGFGAAQGSSTVSLGGAEVSRYLSWSDRQLVVQLGPGNTSGDLVVHVSGDGYSNGLPFEITTGKIYFVDVSGDDLDDGSFETPFETLPHCVSVLAPGGICYVRDGVVSQLDTDGAALVLSTSTLAGLPKAVISYPGEQGRVQSVGDKGVLACNDAVDCSDDGHWVVAKLRIEAPVLALDAREISGLRFVGNSVACASAALAGDCVAIADGASEVSLLGNTITVPTSMGGTTPAIVSLGANVANVNLGWNELRGPAAASGVRVSNAGGLSLHDNLVRDVRSRGLDLGTFVFAPGALDIVNNVIARVGGNGQDTDACVYLGGSLDLGSVSMRHNTLFDCGAPLGAALHMTGTQCVAHNNLFVQEGATSFTRVLGFGTGLTGDSNLFSGPAALPNQTTNNIVGDPAFEAEESYDFHLRAESDAIDAGNTNTTQLDRDGHPRDGAPDVGAYERSP